MSPGDTPAGDGPVTGSAPEGAVVVEIPARTEFVSFVRVIVAAAAELEPDMAPERIDDLRLVVSEATTNAIEANLASGTLARVRVRCDLGVDGVVVEVHDEAGGFDPSTVPELPPPESPERLLYERGLGLRLMRLLSDETEIHSDHRGTDVRLVVYTDRHRRELLGSDAGADADAVEGDAGAGADAVEGDAGAGADTVEGDAGADAGAGADTVEGDAGADAVEGDA